MSSKNAVWLGTVLGSTIGGMIPTLWDDSFMSFSSIIFSAIGAIIGIYIGYTMSQQ